MGQIIIEFCVFGYVNNLFFDDLFLCDSDDLDVKIGGVRCMTPLSHNSFHYAIYSYRAQKAQYEYKENLFSEFTVALYICRDDIETPNRQETIWRILSKAHIAWL